MGAFCSMRRVSAGAAALLSIVWLLACGSAFARPAPDPDAVQEVLAGLRTEANAAWWGFDPDDSTEYLQAAIDSGVPRLIVPNMGQDWVVRPIFLRSNQEIIFEEGVVITAKKGEYRGRNDSVFTARDVENLTLRGYGATIRMHKSDYAAPPYEKAEWRMGISLRGSTNVEISGFTIRETGGDAIYLGRGAKPYNENIVIRDVVADSNYRQGISVISVKGLLIENSVFRNTSGTPPMAGIDFEPNQPDERLEDIVIRNTVFENNEGPGVHFYLKNLGRASTVSILLENILVRGSTTGINISLGDVEDQPAGEIVIRRCIVEGSQRSGIAVRDKEGDQLRIAIEECVVYDVASRPGFTLSRHNLQNAVPIYLGAAREMGGVTLRDVVVIDSVERPALFGAVRDPEGAGFAGIEGNLRVVSPYGAALLWEGPSEGVTLAAAAAEEASIDYAGTISISEYALPAATVRVGPAVRFANLPPLDTGSPIRGVLRPGIELLHFPPDDVRRVDVVLDEQPVYSETAAPEPESFAIDTTSLEDGPHHLRVIVTGERAGTVERSVYFVTQNFEYLIDPFEGPKEVAWLGTVYKPVSIDQSAGWQYHTDRPEDFFRDATRKARVGDTTEFIVWATPRLYDFTFDLYTRSQDLGEGIRVEGSPDQQSWRTLGYEVVHVDTSAAGWHKVQVRGTVDAAAEIAFVRLTVEESVAASELQLGQAAFRLLRR